MKQPFLFTVIAALASMLFIGSEGVAQKDAPRFEIGGQFSLLSVNTPTSQDEAFGFGVGKVKDPGFGARFTYNATNEIAFEAEGNFFLERNFKPEGSFGAGTNNVPGGQIYQGQFGVKAGKRFKKIGLFGKIRPGFVTFTKVSHLVGLTEVTLIHVSLGPLRFQNPEFRIGKATYPSMDVGGVVEFYPSRRIVTRFDVGDTIIRYGVYREPQPVVCTGVCPPPDVFERPAETRHNLQFSAGIGIRF